MVGELPHGHGHGLIIERTPQYAGTSNQTLQSLAALRQSLKDKLRIMKRKTLPPPAVADLVFVRCRSLYL
jgi:hypothetical protein